MNRRFIVGGLAGIAGTSLGLRSARAAGSAAASAIDPADKNHLALLHRKLAFSADNRALIWWLRGTKYGSINGQITPLWILNVALFHDVTHGADGAMEVRGLEVVYKTDAATDVALSSWRNPYTGEEHPEVPEIMGPFTTRFDATGEPTRSALPGAKIQRRMQLGPAEVVADDVWLNSDSHVEVDREGQATFRAHDLSTYYGRVSDVLDPATPSAPATMALHMIQSWHPWMKMGDREGTLITRAKGKKCFSIDQMHPTIAQFVREKHPEIAANFVARLKDLPPALGK